MIRRSLAFFAPLLLGIAMTSSGAVPPVALPPAEDDALAALEHSPRHGEYIDIPYADHAPIRAWIVYPERAEKAGVVVVIHEIFGLSDWIRGVTDRRDVPWPVPGGTYPEELAEAGQLARHAQPADGRDVHADEIDQPVADQWHILLLVDE